MNWLHFLVVINQWLQILNSEFCWEQLQTVHKLTRLGTLNDDSMQLWNFGVSIKPYRHSFYYDKE